jgi:hypothetical protein
MDCPAPLRRFLRVLICRVTYLYLVILRNFEPSWPWLVSPLPPAKNDVPTAKPRKITRRHTAPVLLTRTARIIYFLLVFLLSSPYLPVWA